MKNNVPQLILPIIFVVVTGFWFIAMTFGPIIHFLINKSPDVGGVMAIAVGAVIFFTSFYCFNNSFKYSYKKEKLNYRS